MIIRRRHTANYTTIGNVLFEDERLAADEVGILAYLLSRPHDWEVRRPALMRRWGMGRDAIKRVITNLVRFGWCRPEKTRLPNGTYFFIYEIRDEPGPQLSDEEVRRALSLVSSEAAPTEADDIAGPEGAPDGAKIASEPPTGYPSLADPSPGKAQVADINIQTTDLPRTDSTQKLERERTRAREKHASNLVLFKQRWPNSAHDDQTRVDNAWSALSFEEGEAALANIDAFLNDLKASGRSHPPAGFNYLGQKRWTLLKSKPQGTQAAGGYAPASAEAKAVKVIHELAGRLSAFFTIWRRADGTVTYRKPMTVQWIAMAQAGERPSWVTLTKAQAAAWDRLLEQFFEQGAIRTSLREGSCAPWPWPPSVEGKIYTVDGERPPDQLMTDQDYQDFKS